MAERTPILSPSIEEYLRGLLEPREGILARLEEEAAREGIPICSPDTGQLLELLTRILRPERVLEIGTAIGYAAIRIGRCLPSWGSIDTIEVDLETADRALKNAISAGLAGVVQVLRGSALQVLPTLSNRYDLVFIDAKKSEYEAYLALVLEKMPKGAVVVVDNLLWGGRVVAGPYEGDEAWRAESTEAIRRFNHSFTTFPGLKAQVLPVGDGLGLGVRV